MRHELNQGNENEEVERINEKYHHAKKELKDQGFRVEVLFYVKIAIATRFERNEREEEQTAVLLKWKGVFSVSGIYRNIGSMCVSFPSVIKAQRQKPQQQQVEKIVYKKIRQM